MIEYNITLFEACEKLNRSKKTLSRYIRKRLLHPKEVKSKQGTLEYRFSEQDIEAFKEKEAERRQDKETADGTEETIVYTPLPQQEADFPLREIKTDETRQDGTIRADETGQEEAREIFDTIKKEKKPLRKIHTEETGHATPDQTRRDRTGQDEVITLLKETTGLLKEQIKVKDEQIKDLGGKIDQLIERDRETNILLRGLQDKVFLLEQPKKAKGKGRGKAETADETGQDAPEQAKESFFKRIFKGDL